MTMNEKTTETCRWT